MIYVGNDLGLHVDRWHVVYDLSRCTRRSACDMCGVGFSNLGRDSSNPSVAIKEFSLSYHNPDTISITICPSYCNLS